ncbi:unnamed protein product [Orchesella dallaii]|uniref:F-box domain-containing protein n=1 Tax=Orchesella dallaii TaxID=48710 RepID=A0ABP1S6Z0_9HEXA
MSWLPSCLRGPKKDVDEEFKVKVVKVVEPEAEIVYPAVTLVFGLLPEIWERILTDLPPKDFLCAINTYPEWRKLVSAPKKAAILFPMVFPLLIKYFPVNTFLNCRRISKETNKCLEEILETSLFPPDELDFAFDIPRKLSYEEATRHRKVIYICFKARMEFTNSSSTSRFRQHYLVNLNQTKPLADSFMWRTISVDLDENVEDVLSRIGQHVRNLHMFQCKPKDLTSIRNMTCVLSLCTNIKSLKIRSSTRYTHREYNYNNQNFTVQFPKLPFFEELDVMGFHNEDTEQFMRFAFFPILEQYGSQLKTLKFSGQILELDFVTVRMLQELAPNLKCILIDSLSPIGVEKLSQVENWEPTDLHIQLVNICTENEEGGLKPIQLFENTIRELHVSLQYFAGNLVFDGVYSELKILLIKTRDGIDLADMDFWEFLPSTCPRLEQLQLQTKMVRRDKVESTQERHKNKAMQTFRRLPSLTKVAVWYDRDQKVFRRPAKSQLAQ